MENKHTRINGIDFTVDGFGNVSTPEFGPIGHIEECKEFAELFTSLAEICDEIILTDDGKNLGSSDS